MTKSELSVEEQIDDIDVSDEMKDSFLEYAYSVIYARALPDARDGLKPVQRRILYQMDRMGLTKDKGHVKSQRVVGEVMGKLHPHGDAPIYDALVRLAQDFNLRVPLIDGHGNFGSLDDGPAAARYTEARLAGSASLLTDDLDKSTVDFVPNYDNQFQQPQVLPAQFPSLLVNGAAGIAVGMATSIPPHNPAETIHAALHLLENPDATTEDLMRFLPGPDFPGGGIIQGLEGVRDAYETGRGSFKVRAKTSVERITARRNGIVVTELPYMVGPERVIQKIKDGVNAGRIKGVSGASDLTDREHGLRLVIDVKSGFDPDQVLALLFKHTPLEESFSTNAVALVNGEPRTLPLRDILKVFVDHRLEVTKRKAQHEEAEKRKRLHLVEGLLKAVLNIDDVIQVIRSSENTEEARSRLMLAFDLSETQAQHILELRLRRLTKFSTLELETEQTQLNEELERLRELLASDQKLANEVARNLRDTASILNSPRRTTLLDAPGTTAVAADPQALEIADEPCVAVLTPSGQLCRILGDEAPADPSSGSDLWRSWAVASTRGKTYVITEDGLAHEVLVELLPGVPRSNLNQTLAGAVSFEALTGVKTKPIGLYSGDDPQRTLSIGTKQGVIKRLRHGDLPNRSEFPVITLAKGDAVIGTSNGFETDFAVFITSLGQLLKFPLSIVRPQGLAAGGVAGIKLAAGDQAIFYSAVEETPDATVVTVSGSSDAIPWTFPGRVKLSDLSEFPAKGRATQGVRAHRFLQGEDILEIAWAGPRTPVAKRPDNKDTRLPAERSRRDGSGSAAPAVIAQLG